MSSPSPSQSAPTSGTIETAHPASLHDLALSSSVTPTTQTVVVSKRIPSPSVSLSSPSHEAGVPLCTPSRRVREAQRCPSRGELIAISQEPFQSCPPPKPKCDHKRDLFQPATPVLAPEGRHRNGINRPEAI